MTFDVWRMGKRVVCACCRYFVVFHAHAVSSRVVLHGIGNDMAFLHLQHLTVDIELTGTVTVTDIDTHASIDTTINYTVRTSSR